jgi:membrane protease YdiL (CAAX protease family)
MLPEDPPAPPSNDTASTPAEPDMASPTAPEAGGPVAVPMARPVTANGDHFGLTILPYARPAPWGLPWWLALLEAIAPLVTAILGTIGAVPLLFVWRPADDRWSTVIMTVVGGLMAITVCAALLRLHGQRPGSIGWTTRHLSLDVLIGIGAYLGTTLSLLALLSIVASLYPQILEHENDAARAIQETLPNMSLAGATVFMAFVALWEEITFRGFMLTRLHAALGRWWVALPVGAFLFGLGHLYEGPVAFFQTLLLGFVLGFLFWWRKSLVPGIAFHLLNNVTAYALTSLLNP